MALCDRIKEARITSGLTQLQVAEALGVAKSSISSYENGTREPPPSVISELITVLHTDANFLFQDEINAEKKTVGLNAHEAEIIKKYRSLDSHGEKVVDAVLELEYERCTEETQIIDFSLERGSGRLVARNGHDLTEGDKQEIIDIANRWLKGV